MGKGILTLFCLLIALQVWGAEATTLRAVLPEVQAQQLQEVGSLQVEGVGTVTLSARQAGKQLTVQAIGPDGTVIGQAESVTGVRETPVAVITSKGLMTLLIMWEKQ